MNNILSLFQSLTQNPMQTLASWGLNVPQNISFNPEAIVQYLLSSGQISQDHVNQAMQMRNNPMFKGLFRGMP